MSASQVIEEIKNLPETERKKVLAFCQTLVSEPARGDVVYVKRDEAMQVLEEVLDRNDALFKKLAQ